MPYQALQHLNQKQARPVLVFLTLTSFAQIHYLPPMPHSAVSLPTGCEHGCPICCARDYHGYLTYYAQGYQIHFLTDCALNFLDLVIDLPNDFWQDSPIHSVQNYQNDSGSDPDYQIHFWLEWQIYYAWDYPTDPVPDFLMHFAQDSQTHSSIDSGSVRGFQICCVPGCQISCGQDWPTYGVLDSQTYFAGDWRTHYEERQTDYALYQGTDSGNVHSLDSQIGYE